MFFLALELALALFWNKADSDTGKYSWQQYICAYTPNRLLANVLIELPLQSTMVTTKWEKSEMLGGLGCMFLLVTQSCALIYFTACVRAVQRSSLMDADLSYLGVCTQNLKHTNTQLLWEVVVSSLTKWGYKIDMP